MENALLTMEHALLTMEHALLTDGKCQTLIELYLVLKMSDIDIFHSQKSIFHCHKRELYLVLPCIVVYIPGRVQNGETLRNKS